MGINGWRIMWLIAAYDCPVSTREARRAYQRFHSLLLEENFSQHQYSLYVRHFPTMAAAQAEADKLGKAVPEDARVAFYFITDKQYGMTREFFGKEPTNKKPSKPLQIELF